MAAIPYPIEVPPLRGIIPSLKMTLLTPADRGRSGGVVDLSPDIPTARETLHAILTSENDLYIQSTLRFRGHAELLSTWVEARVPPPEEIIRPGHVPVRVIDRPDGLERRDGRWVLVGGVTTNTALPPTGWYGASTDRLFGEAGLPSQTWPDRKTAVEDLATLRGRPWADRVASMFLAELPSSPCRVYRAYGSHPIGAFRLRLLAVEHGRSDIQWFLARRIITSP